MTIHHAYLAPLSPQRLLPLDLSQPLSVFARTQRSLLSANATPPFNLVETITDVPSLLLKGIKDYYGGQAIGHHYSNLSTTRSYQRWIHYLDHQLQTWSSLRHLYYSLELPLLWDFNLLVRHSMCVCIYNLCVYMMCVGEWRFEAGNTVDVVKNPIMAFFLSLSLIESCWVLQ